VLATYQRGQRSENGHPPKQQTQRNRPTTKIQIYYFHISYNGIMGCCYLGLMGTAMLFSAMVSALEAREVKMGIHTISNLFTTVYWIQFTSII
jgi:hypothetical protein